jgi:hypothetical protein
MTEALAVSPASSAGASAHRPRDVITQVQLIGHRRRAVGLGRTRPTRQPRTCAPDTGLIITPHTRTAPCPLSLPSASERPPVSPARAAPDDDQSSAGARSAPTALLHLRKAPATRPLSSSMQSDARDQRRAALRYRMEAALARRCWRCLPGLRAVAPLTVMSVRPRSRCPVGPDPERWAYTSPRKPATKVKPTAISPRRPCPTPGVGVVMVSSIACATFATWKRAAGI